jgi:hypothetical protein
MGKSAGRDGEEIRLCIKNPESDGLKSKKEKGYCAEIPGA